MPRKKNPESRVMVQIPIERYREKLRPISDKFADDYRQIFMNCLDAYIDIHVKDLEKAFHPGELVEVSDTPGDLIPPLQESPDTSLDDIQSPSSWM